MENSKQHSKDGNYRTFFIMLACSFVAMYITMYLNTYSLDHVFFSLTRFYMVCLGIAAMAVIMWFFMRKMYNDKKKNIGILITDHNVRETLEIVDRACIIYGGQVLFAGTPQDLVADENVKRLYLGEGFTL